MNLQPLTAAKVTAAAETAGWAIRTLSESTGIAYTTLWRKMRGLASFTVEDIEHIAEALNVDPNELVVFRQDAA